MAALLQLICCRKTGQSGADDDDMQRGLRIRDGGQRRQCSRRCRGAAHCHQPAQEFAAGEDVANLRCHDVLRRLAAAGAARAALACNARPLRPIIEAGNRTLQRPACLTRNERSLRRSQPRARRCPPGGTAAAANDFRCRGATAPAGAGQAARCGVRASGKLHSMILWGPPGVGKTTLARLMADAFNAEFIALSACCPASRTSAKPSPRAEASLAQSGRATILFVDEVHRFNKAQQDAFLPYVERGTVTFIGATTENPSFEVIGALLSRAAVYVLEPLSAEDLGTLLDRAAAIAAPAMKLELPAARRARCLRRWRWPPSRQSRRAAGGRRSGKPSGRRSTSHSWKPRSRAACAASTRAARRSYDQISALHKAVRGSDPDAALYWMCRMLDGGAAPLYVARRIIRMARRGHRPRRSARAAHGAGRGGNLRAPGLARRRARTCRMRALPCRGAEVERRLRRLQRRARIYRRGWFPPGADAPAQRADQAHEEPGLRQRLSLRTRRGRRIRWPAKPTFPTTWHRSSSTRPPIADWRRRSAKSSITSNRAIGSPAAARTDSASRPATVLRLRETAPRRAVRECLP